MTSDQNNADRNADHEDAQDARTEAERAERAGAWHALTFEDAYELARILSLAVGAAHVLLDAPSSYSTSDVRYSVSTSPLSPSTLARRHVDTYVNGARIGDGFGPSDEDLEPFTSGYAEDNLDEAAEDLDTCYGLVPGEHVLTSLVEAAERAPGTDAREALLREHVLGERVAPCKPGEALRAGARVVLGDGTRAIVEADVEPAPLFARLAPLFCAVRREDAGRTDPSWVVQTLGGEGVWEALEKQGLVLGVLVDWRTDAQRASDRAESAGLDVEDVLVGFARAAYADAWSNAHEALHASVGAVEDEDEGEDAQDRAEREAFAGRLGSLSGVDVYEAAPSDVPGEFRAFARETLALVFLHVPAPTLRRWGDWEDHGRDSEDIGSDLYLDSVGHGAGLADRDLPTVRETCPANAGPLRNFGYLSAPDVYWSELRDEDDEAPLVQFGDAIDACGRARKGRSAEGAALAIVGLSRALRKGTIGEDEALERVDALLDGFGVESVELPAPDEDSDEGRFTYVNLGDTYASTVGWLDDCNGARLVVSSWGAVMEDAERERTLRTGQTRCGYCAAWKGGLDSHLTPLDYRETECPDCGHVE